MSNIILCADDSKTMQTVAEITFRVSEYTYVGAMSADEAIQKAREQKPVLILADAVMPGKTGYDLCQMVKSDPQLAGIPVVMLCGNSSAYDTAMGSQVGADGHLSKPWDSQVMLGKVAEILEKAGSAVTRVAAQPRGVRAPTTPAAPLKPATPKTPPAGLGKPPVKPPPKPPIKPIDLPQPPAGAAGRSHTIMGMPTVTPPKQPAGPALKPLASPPQPRAASEAKLGRPNTARPSPDIKPPAPPAITSPVARPAAPPVTRPGIPAQKRPPAPAKPAAAAAPAMRRAPMIKGKPLKRPVFQQPSAVLAPLDNKLAAATQAAVNRAARATGLDPNGPEMKALLALSRDVVEQVVWQVVPDLAEAIIHERMEQWAASE